MSLSDSLDSPSGAPWLGRMHRLPEPTAPLAGPTIPAAENLPWRVSGRTHAGKRFRLNVLAPNNTAAYALAVAVLGEHPEASATMCLQRRPVDAAPAPAPQPEPEPPAAPSVDTVLSDSDDYWETHGYPHGTRPVAWAWLLSGTAIGAVLACVGWMLGR